MQAIFNFVSTNPQFISRFRLFVSYCSVALFVAFIAFVSLSVNKFINDTMSTTIAKPELIDSVEEQLDEISQSVIVKKGDTLNTILRQQKIPSNEILQITKLVKDKNLISSLQIGQQLIFDYDIKVLEESDGDLASEVRVLTRVILTIDKTQSLEIIRGQDGFYAKDVVVQFNKSLVKSSAVVESNFMSSLKSLGLSNNSIIELVNSYSYQIDFQRQIKKGDTITVINEEFLAQDGKYSHNGKILYVSLNLSGKEYKIYRYSPDGLVNNQMFFSEDGKSVKRSLLRTPVKLVRVSSHYGKRQHPTLGYTKMHRGIDFAAPRGTPIYAAGNGVITELGWKSGYGKFVQIKHSQTLSTAYAHASNFAKNLKVGSVVKQGQVIAYVGSTGRTTGAHLHYEVKVSGRNINPMSVKTTPGVELTGKQLAKFQQFKNKVSTLSAELNDGAKVFEKQSLLSMN
jgi:murein DD-endopeptidase MepM/ murein hydrolase activator NlpD